MTSQMTSSTDPMCIRTSVSILVTNAHSAKRPHGGSLGRHPRRSLPTRGANALPRNLEVRRRENHLRARQLMPHAFGVFRFAVFALALGRAAMTAASALLSSALLSSALLSSVGQLALDGVRR